MSATSPCCGSHKAKLPAISANAGLSSGRFSTASGRHSTPALPERGISCRDLTAHTVRRRELEMDVLYGQEGFAEQLAAGSPHVGDDAAAQVDQMAAHGKVVAHVNVRAVHGDGGPTLGKLRRRTEM